MRYAYIEKLDGRNPLFPLYKHRIFTCGQEVNSAFRKFMDQSFGDPLRYHTAKSLLSENKLSGNTWVLDWMDDTYYEKAHFYFSDEMAPLIFLKFKEERHHETY